MSYFALAPRPSIKCAYSAILAGKTIVWAGEPDAHYASCDQSIVMIFDDRTFCVIAPNDQSEAVILDVNLLDISDYLSAATLHKAGISNARQFKELQKWEFDLAAHRKSVRITNLRSELERLEGKA